MNPVAVRGLSPMEVLGLPPSASEEEVRGSFRLLAKVVHPDVLPRGGGLFRVLQAALEASLVGNAWPGLLSLPGGYEAGFPPGVPNPPSAPRSSRSAPAWKQNKKGNWFRKVGGAYLTVYEKGESWRWVGPDLDRPDQSVFSSEGFESAASAMDDADFTFGPGVGGGR